MAVIKARQISASALGYLQPRTVAVVVASMGLAIAAYFLWKSYTTAHFLPQMAPRGISSATEEARPRPLGEVLVSLEEILVNVESRQSAAPRSLAVKLELELFDEGSKSFLDQRQSGLKNTIIETASEQNYENLSTPTGKLYFKELLVRRMNEFLRRPVIREVHFSIFYLN